MDKCCAFAWLLGLSLVIGTAAPVEAETAPVTVSGDEVHYDYHLQQIEVFGNVRLSYKKIKVTADYALIDQQQDVLLATGHVQVDREEDQYQGERFIYYIRPQQGWLMPLATEITAAEIKGRVFLTASDAFLQGEDIRLKKSYFTSCELAKPHFHLTAAAIEYYPESRIVFHQVWYWEGRIRLFYLPYLAVSLQDKQNNFEFQVGQTYEEGWFLHVGYNYFISDTSYGLVKLRTTEYGGDGIGVKHTIEGSKTSKWWQEYFLLDNSDREIDQRDYLYSFGYSNWDNPQRKTESQLLNWHRYTLSGDSYLENDYQFTQTGNYPYPNLYFRFSETNQDYDRMVADLKRVADFAANWRYQPDSSFSNTVSGRCYLAEELLEDNPVSNFKYNITSFKDWHWSQAKLTYTDTAIFSGGMYSYNYKPDLLYTIPKWDWPLLGEVKLIAQYTNLEKFPSDDSGQRLGLDLQRAPFKLWQNQDRNLTLHTGASLRYRELQYSSNGNDYQPQLTALTGDVGLTDQFTKALATTVKLGFTETSGTLINDDFFYRSDNAILPGAFVANSWLLKTADWRATWATGYNFYHEYAEPMTISASWEPDTKYLFNFHTIYYWGAGAGLTDLRLNFQPKELWRLALVLGYDFSNPDYPWANKQFEAAISNPISRQWRFELASRFDFFANEFAIGQVNLIRDWHCRELFFHFDWIEERYWLQINFKAFPQAQLRLGPNPMELLQPWE